ncbi:hypothetical protein Tsubulata_021106 [Turnera subulata]|uniref:PORR domain-containing protein n=1 Tax=Turnera subulata TaxID=218843 RepID=A0A9Q0JPP1_9ROSI|nr:hypothetical protein Tsubulata_021106 [Turnera subulata]
MQSLFRSLPKPLRRRHHDHRTITDVPAIKHVRDRGLDHVVEREKHLKPVLNIKNLIKAEPSKSLPISIISQHRTSLSIPTRPIEFIRRYPSVFEEHLPGGIAGVHPHIKLTPQVLDLDAEEQLVYQSESYKRDVADRLLKLLMVTRIDKIPLKILNLLKWEMGLPDDYVESLVPEFPDYFRVIGEEGGLVSGSGSDLGLELVCWSDALAVSVMEKKVKGGVEKGEAIAFPMKFSRGFEMDKKLKKWFDDWQKLPYISPYENAMHLGPTTDESDKWAVGVLHEVLNLFVSKKVERDLLLGLGEWLGIRSRFKRALLHHPGIFYLSSKIGTYTVVLKDAYKRGVPIEKNQLRNVRNRYIHLMHAVVEERKAVSVPGASKQQGEKPAEKSEGQEDDKDTIEVNDLGSDFEDVSDEDYEHDEDEDEDDEEEEDRSRRQPRRNVQSGRGREAKKNLSGRSRNSRMERMVEESHGKPGEKFARKTSERPRKEFSRVENDARRRGFGMGKNSRGNSNERSTLPKRKGRLVTEKRTAV